MSDPANDLHERAGDEADRIFESIHQLMHLFRSKQYEVLKGSPYDITHLEGKMLGFLAERPGASLSDLVGRTGKDKSQLARLIAALKKQGLLEGVQDEHDRRSVRLHLSRQGKAVHEALGRQLGEFSRIAVSGLGNKERSKLLELLERVRTTLRDS